MWVRHEISRTGDEAAPRIRIRSNPGSPLSSNTAYKVVGDLKPLPDIWNNAYGTALAAKCAHAGRVIPTTSDGFGEERFFTAYTTIGGAPGAWLAVRALDRALADAAVHPEQVVCERPRSDTDEDVNACRSELLTRHALQFGRLLSVSLEPCPAASPNCIWVKGEFLASAQGNEQMLWELSVRAETSGQDRSTPEVGAVGDIRLGAATSITD